MFGTTFMQRALIVAIMAVSGSVVRADWSTSGATIANGVCTLTTGGSITQEFDYWSPNWNMITFDVVGGDTNFEIRIKVEVAGEWSPWEFEYVIDGTGTWTCAPGGYWTPGYGFITSSTEEQPSVTISITSEDQYSHELIIDNIQLWSWSEVTEDPLVIAENPWENGDFED